ncbi:transketolase [Patescibacteria group bacterium]|nr:transketolase [Patescibacteria group bacterium]
MTIEQLERRALAIREDIIVMLEEAGSGHPGGALGMADIYAALYFEVMRHDPKKPEWPGRDRLILSCGHTCPVRYAAMAESGYFPRKELLTLRKFGTRLQGHPHNLAMPGLETTSGPLGQGLSQAVGMALAARLDGENHRIYCVTSDGEHDEGQIWEAVMFAAARKLDNLTVIVDRNRIQIEGDTETVMPLDPFAEKYRAFNWEVIEIDGNNMKEVLRAFHQAKQVSGRPVCIMANVVPGKGVDFMEGNYKWHGVAPKPEEAEKALEDLWLQKVGEPA